MANGLTPSFTAARTSNLTDLLLTDTSTGSNVAIVARQVSLITSTGSLLPAGVVIPWALADSTITIANVYPIDYALQIKVEWLDAGGDAVYTVIELADAPQDAQLFAYSLIQLQAGNPSIVDRSNWWPNLVRLYCYIKNSMTAVETGEDIASAQYNLNLARNMSSQPGVFFQSTLP